GLPRLRGRHRRRRAGERSVSCVCPLPVALALADRVSTSQAKPWRLPLVPGFVLTTELGLGLTILRAMVIAHLWQWFAADPFGLPRAGVVPVAGLLLIWGFLAAYIGRD